MCGIFAYISYLSGNQLDDLLIILLNGLKRLEYRGYDSAGIGFDFQGKTLMLKSTGKVSCLESLVTNFLAETPDLAVGDHSIGIAHTRWATHGVPSDVNSHPHTSDDGNEFIVVHNGIITNFKCLKALLESFGYQFKSQTDTEVIPKLLHHVYHNLGEKNDFIKVVEQAISQIEGSFALAIKSKHFPGEIVGARRGSPLLVGIKCYESLTISHIPVFYNSKNMRSEISSHFSRSRLPSTDGNDQTLQIARNHGAFEFFLASDASALIEHTDQVIYLEDDDLVAIRDSGNLTIHRMNPSKVGLGDTRKIETVRMALQQIMKGNFDYYMQKEIFEQTESVVNTMRGRVNFEQGSVTLGGISDYISVIKRSRRLMFIACGTSFYSAVATRSLLEELTELPVSVELASDFMDRHTPVFRDDMCVFISQSGETADTLMALRHCSKHGALTMGVTNTVGSSISRESQFGIHINAGPEIGVASTKAYTSQILCLVMFALVLAEDKKSKTARIFDIVQALKSLPEQIGSILKKDAEIRLMAESLHDRRNILVMGRGPNYATCLEGALKLKELTYIHAEGILSGELKHGPLAMVDQDMTIIMIVTRDSVFNKSMNALHEVIARRGMPILICFEDDQEMDKYGSKLIRVPKTVDCLQSILAVIPLQLLAFHIAVKKGLDVDCPRNLAKSVTVE